LNLQIGVGIGIGIDPDSDSDPDPEESHPISCCTGLTREFEDGASGWGQADGAKLDISEMPPYTSCPRQKAPFPARNSGGDLVWGARVRRQGLTGAGPGL